MRIIAIICSVLMGTTVAAMAQEYPLTIDHKYGTTVIPEQPLRIATVDYAGADNILAFGFQPLTSRYWFGPAKNGLWPWAQELSTQEPEVLTGELNFEQIAKTDPDVIFAIRSGITPEEYEQLSRIAPTIAVPVGVGDYELTWDDRARLVGHVLGKDDEAAAMIAAIEEQISTVAAEHPQWQNHDFALATFWEGSIGAYSASDTTVVLLNRLGLNLAPGVEAVSVEGEFYVSLSAEYLEDLDADVLIWYADSEQRANIIALPLYPLLTAPKEGREIVLSNNSLLNGQLSYGSLLAMPNAINLLVPAIEAALDGDPSTSFVLDE